MTYREFLESKIELATDSGFVVEQEHINKALKPHQKDAVAWALKGGRRALFESFGLGKTVQELEFCHLAAEHENGRALIVLPLGVKQEFTRDGITQTEKKFRLKLLHGSHYQSHIIRGESEKYD